MSDNIFAVIRKNNKKNGRIMTQKELEREIKIGHVNELEKGRRMPSLAQLQAYHSYFGISYDCLLESILNDRKTAKDIVQDVEIPEWLQDTCLPDEQMMAQLLHELTETGKGMVLLSYLAELIYSKQSDDNKYQPIDFENEVHNFFHVIKEYRKINDSARYGEAKIRIKNVIESAKE